MDKPKRKFQPKSVSRRSKEERDSSAPAIKEEPVDTAPQKPQEGVRRRREIKGEYLDEAQGPLSAPSLGDNGAKRRPGGFSAPSGGHHTHHQVNPSAGGPAAAPKFNGDMVDISKDNGSYTPQVVAKESIEKIDAPTLISGSHYLFNLPPLSDQEDAMDTTTQAPIGTLRTHASGKMTMLINGCVYELTTGIPTNTVQDIMLIEGETAYKLGHVRERMVVVPTHDE